VLRHPRCARDRAEDIEEVGLMIDAGELEVARDELQWLLSGCTDCLDAHLLLGQLALDGQNDYELARGHFGYAYQLGLRAWRRAGEPTPVRYAQLPNRGFFEAGRALAWCLEKLNKRTMADEVVEVLVKLDPEDPLGCRKMLAELRDTGSLPML
jgi:tetratricopeptide (TPR) repeat protein